jgi:D-sedoheptulose 7-phosphate isomerase
MTNDTRSRNKSFPLDSIHSFFDGYKNGLLAALDNVDKEKLNAAVKVLMSAREKGNQIFVGGNGGSSAIAEHLECDFQKGCHHDNKTLITRSLTSNAAMLTAIGNDLGYEKTFSYQLELLAKPQDIVLLISSSGNSPNIVLGATKARDLGCFVIGMTGFEGGVLKDISDISLHVPYNNYGIVEDSHQAIMHALSQFMYRKLLLSPHV